MGDRWDRIVNLYHEALARSSRDRGAFLEETCGDDPTMRAEVEKLLQYDAKAGDFLEQPAAFQLTKTLVAIRDQWVGRYELGTRLGAGGMGEVWLATDSRLNRQVALKVLLPEMNSHPDSRARFLREARSAAALSHPHIAAVFDAGEANGRLYLAMEFIDGQPLRALVRNGPLGRPRPFSSPCSLPLRSSMPIPAVSSIATSSPKTS